MKTARLLVMLFVLAPVADAAEPTSLLDLFNRVPDVPANAQEAMKWFDKGGKLIHPGMLALKADIDSNRQAGRITAQSAGNASSIAPMMQGMENAGIDVARMQRDPAYQKEIQQRIQQMSSQEQMALMNKMMQPHMQASTQDVKAMAQESPAVQTAAEAARMFPQRQSS